MVCVMGFYRDEAVELYGAYRQHAGCLPSHVCEELSKARGDSPAYYRRTFNRWTEQVRAPWCDWDLAPGTLKLILGWAEESRRGTYITAHNQFFDDPGSPPFVVFVDRLARHYVVNPSVRELMRTTAASVRCSRCISADQVLHLVLRARDQSDLGQRSEDRLRQKIRNELRQSAPRS